MHVIRAGYVTKPAWRRVARITGYVAFGVALVLFLIAVLTYVKPVLP